MNNNMVVVEVSAALLNVQENLNNKPAQKQEFDEKLKNILDIVLRDKYFLNYFFN